MELDGTGMRVCQRFFAADFYMSVRIVLCMYYIILLSGSTSNKPKSLGMATQKNKNSVALRWCQAWGDVRLAPRTPQHI